MTLNPISIGYVDEAMKAGEEFGIMPSYFNVTRPRWFTLKSLPDDVRDFYLDRLYAQDFKMIQKCTKAIEYLEKREFDQSLYEEMIVRIKARDKLRNDNILNHFPEWKAHFKGEYYE